MLMITSDFPYRTPTEFFYHINDYLWYIISYEIHFLTPQRVSGRLLSKSIIFLSSPQWTLLAVTLTIHLNNTSLIISSKLHLKVVPISPWNLWSNPISLMKFFIFTVTSSLPSLNGKNPKLGGFSIGYVHDTSELTDNQASSSSPVRTIPLPLCLVRHLLTAGLWIYPLPNGYVHITSEPTNA